MTLSQCISQYLCLSIPFSLSLIPLITSFVFLSSSTRRLYWALWGNNAKIESSRLDGSNRVLFVNQDVEWPAGLALDAPNQRLYWTDPKKRTIESITLDGKDRIKVRTFSAGMEKGWKYEE